MPVKRVQTIGPGELGSRLKQAREDAGLTQQEAVDLLNRVHGKRYKRANLGNAEQGDPAKRNVAVLGLQALGYEVEERYAVTKRKTPPAVAEGAARQERA
ncbi:MAG: hypothetical protein AAGI08_03910 [Bacteroidota bacterium]